MKKRVYYAPKVNDLVFQEIDTIMSSDIISDDSDNDIGQPVPPITDGGTYN